jgi:DNA-binding NarL/FixJ family response regulator
MFNATDTMNSVRWLLNKYSWMSAGTDVELPKNPADRKFRPGLSPKEKKKILSLYEKGYTVNQIAATMGRSNTAVRKLIIDVNGALRGVQAVKCGN